MSEKNTKKRTCFATRIDKDILEKCRDAVYWTPGLTLSDLVREGMLLKLGRLEQNNGKLFPPREGDLIKGRL